MATQTTEPSRKRARADTGGKAVVVSFADAKHDPESNMSKAVLESPSTKDPLEIMKIIADKAGLMLTQDRSPTKQQCDTVIALASSNYQNYPADRVMGMVASTLQIDQDFQNALLKMANDMDNILKASIQSLAIYLMMLQCKNEHALKLLSRICRLLLIKHKSK